jgi:hypothetical protein
MGRPLPQILDASIPLLSHGSSEKEESPMRLFSGQTLAGIAAVLSLLCADQSRAQEPILGALATPQGTTPPGATGGPSTTGKVPGAATGQPQAGSGSAASNLGLESSAFGPNANNGLGPGGPSGLFGAEGAGAGAAGGGFASGLGGRAGISDTPPGIIGDMGPLVTARAVPGLPQPPPIPPPNQPSAPGLPSPKIRSLLSPSVRGFKIADNQSPFPQDRVFFTFNYFNDVNAKLDRYFASPINQLSIYRYIFGYEKTFNDGKGSIGIRLPLNTINAGTSPGLINQGGQSTALGNVTIFAKYILEYNEKTGNLLSVGLAITPPTGPGHFAGASFLGGTNNTTIQPFLGYYLNLTENKKLFLQGFSALDVPVNYSDVTLVYNDLGLGYFLKRDSDATISAIVPTIEVHVNSPLNHRAAYSLNDPAGTPSSVNITSGLNVEVQRNSLFTLGVVAPTTGPRPFNVEAVALFNYRFGASRRPTPTPVIGG